MIFKDYYKILGLETSRVSEEEIRVAFREQAKKYHPDVNIGNKNTEERFKDINEAYNILSDQPKKRKYDRIWNTHIGKKKSSQKGKEKTSKEILHILFGEREANEGERIADISKGKNKKQPIQGENVETEIEISLEDAFFGKVKELSFRTISGKTKKFQVNIPAGIRNNEMIRLLGQGKEGKDGGKNGDLLIRVKIKSIQGTKLIGADIEKEILISPWEAVLGDKVEISFIDEKITIYIPQGSETGDKIIIPNKGYKDGKGTRGKLILIIKIMVPKSITEEEKSIYSKLKKISEFNPRKLQ